MFDIFTNYKVPIQIQKSTIVLHILLMYLCTYKSFFNDRPSAAELLHSREGHEGQVNN